MKTNFSKINISIGMTNNQVRSAIRITMADAGFYNIQDSKRISPIADNIEKNIVDLLITNINLEDGNVCSLIRNVRHHEIGDNPFIMVIAIVESPTSMSIKEVIDAGVDDLVIAPISGTQLLKRIRDLAHRNRKYVVTVDYIGPDRRKKDRPDTPGVQKIPLIEAPNLLNSKMLGGIETSNLARNIEEATKTINEQKIERDAFQIEWLAKRIVPFLEKGEEVSDVTQKITRLLFVSEDICTRTKGSRHQKTHGLCDSMKKLAGKIIDTIDNPDLRDVRHMEKLAQSINQSIMKTK